MVAHRGSWGKSATGTETPFAPCLILREGVVRGGGAIDNEGSLIALREAANAFAGRGFKPVRTVMIVSAASTREPVTMQQDAPSA